MFIDQVTGLPSKPGEKAVKIVTHIRAKHYDPVRDTGTGRMSNEGDGWEIVREITVTEASEALYREYNPAPEWVAE